MNRLEWNRINLFITYQQNNKVKTKTILNNLEGFVLGGQLLAVMGPTGMRSFLLYLDSLLKTLFYIGCGKTSLMNVLSGRITYQKNITLSGNINYNSEEINFAITRRSIGYVGQDETTFAFLTVKETLTLSAYFHESSPMTMEERDTNVTNIIRELGLQKVFDSILGNETKRGVSGGEYKRVLIGKELIKNPVLLFLDEPTSGLDSFQAFSVMETMRRLANRGRVVISVIHQPRSSIFGLFDYLLLLSDGRMIFFGPADAALEYFSSLGYSCPSHFNPADFFLDILSVDYKTEESEKQSVERISSLANHWATTGRSIPFLDIEQRGSTASKRIESQTQDIEQNKSLLHWFQDYRYLQWRCFANMYRNYGALIIRTVTSLFFAALVALIYRNLGYTQKDVQNRIGLLYFILINQVGLF
jgi:ABC-type multidrug transport system ATPase subunit